MRIGELARRTGTAVETIRYYEREHLLPEPQRTAANYRHYQQSHLERLLFIRQCRTLDLSLQEIRALLAVRDNPGGTCLTANQVVDEHIGHVEARIHELQELARQLHRLRQQCRAEHPVAQCGILQGLASEQLPSATAPDTHVK